MPVICFDLRNVCHEQFPMASTEEPWLLSIILDLTELKGSSVRSGLPSIDL